MSSQLEKQVGDAKEVLNSSINLVNPHMALGGLQRNFTGVEFHRKKRDLNQFTEHITKLGDAERIQHV
jgi:hypothetical protein